MQKSDNTDRGKDMAVLVAQLAQEQKTLRLALQTEKEERATSCAKLWDAVPGTSASREEPMKQVTLALDSERQSRNSALGALQSQLVAISQDIAKEREEWTQQRADIRTSLFKHLAELQELVMQERRAREHSVAAEAREQAQHFHKAMEDSKEELRGQLAEERRLRLAAQSSITGHMHEVQKTFVQADADMKASLQNLARQLQEIQASSNQSSADAKAGHAGLELKIAEECNRWSESLEGLTANSREVQANLAQACKKWQADHDALQNQIASERDFYMTSTERLSKQVQPVMGALAQTCATLEADFASLKGQVADEDRLSEVLKGEVLDLNDKLNKLSEEQKNGCTQLQDKLAKQQECCLEMINKLCEENNSTRADLQDQLSKQQECCMALDGQVHRFEGALDRAIAEQQARHVELKSEMSKELILSKAKLEEELQEQLSEERRERMASLNMLQGEQAELQRQIEAECKLRTVSVESTNSRVQEVQLELARARCERESDHDELQGHLAEESKIRATCLENLNQQLQREFQDVSGMTQASLSAVRDIVAEQKEEFDRGLSALNALISDERLARQDDNSELERGLQNQLGQAHEDLRLELLDVSSKEREEAQMLLVQARQLLSEGDLRERLNGILESEWVSKVSEWVSKADFMDEVQRVWSAINGDHSKGSAAAPAASPARGPGSALGPAVSPPRMRSGSPAQGRAFVDPARFRPGSSSSRTHSSSTPAAKDVVGFRGSVTPRDPRSATPGPGSGFSTPGAGGKISGLSSQPQTKDAMVGMAYAGHGIVRISPTRPGSVGSATSGTATVVRQASAPRVQTRPAVSFGT